MAIKKGNNQESKNDFSIKVFEAFAGYGGASFALKKSKIPHEVVGYSENDKYASQIFESNRQNPFSNI